MQYENVDSTEMAEIALSQAVDEHIEKSQEIIDRISELENLILHWNQEDIRDLKKYISEMRVLLLNNFKVQIDNFINMRKIPCVHLPEEIRQTYKVVSVDKKGIALYGVEMDKVAYLSKITEHFNKKKAEMAKAAQAAKDKLKK
ncbi:MAG: hypothetical protein GXY48_05140 [Methanomicrobiales archaeon]|nr:hypothetical protein [Methanomicrobiales archaeon]